MKWCELSIHTTEEALEPVANILHEAGASGVVIEDSEVLRREAYQDAEIYELNPADYPEEGVIVKAYLPVDSALADKIEQIKTAINNLLAYDIDVGMGTITTLEVQEDDWAHAWKKYYKPTKITERITIIPTWEEYEAKDGELIVELDPGMAFGTGTHPTTILAIKMLEQVIRGHEQVIDVGSGSGILSIVALKLGAGHVLALDLDQVAVRATKQNVALNGFASKVEVKQNNLLDGVELEADVIVANILAEVIVRFIADAHRLLRTGGYFLTSGIIAKKEEEVRRALVDHDFAIEETFYQDDWVAFLAKKL